MNVGELKELLKDEPDDRDIVIDIGGDSERLDSYASPIFSDDTDDCRNCIVEFFIEREGFSPILLEL